MGSRFIEQERSVWLPYAATADLPWNVRRVVHLHHRAGFAATWSEIQRDLKDGPRAAIDRLLRGNSRHDGGPDDFDRMAEGIGDSAVASASPNRLKAWWIYRMLFTPDPLAERLALMWHNHFATSNLKVKDLAAMRRQNELFRRLGRGPFVQLLDGVLHDGAMLTWLDAPANRKGKPNENLARELMELFTLGIGHYSETDVKEAARALTGWGLARGRFRFRAELHDDGPKTILAKSGRWNTEDLGRILLEHPATARRIAWRICQTFMGEGVVTAEALEELADGLRHRELDVGWAVETVLRSDLFFSGANIASRVSGPVEFIVSAVRTLEMLERPPSTLILAEWASRLGRDLFYPPNVGGWPSGRAWLTTRTIIGRANFAAALAQGRLTAPPSPPDLDGLLRRSGGGTGDLEEDIERLDQLLLGGRLAAPARAEVLAAAKKDTPGRQEQLRHALATLLARPEAQLCWLAD